MKPAPPSGFTLVEILVVITLVAILTSMVLVNFTGADQRKPGLLQQAAEGTLLLDEIADMPLTAQAKLLRVIENREMIPVGGTRPVQVRARLIAATNKDLLERVQAHGFREDLFHRLNVFAIRIPPLRDRRDDVLPLAKQILGRLAQETGKDLPGLSQFADFVRLPFHAPGDPLHRAEEVGQHANRVF